MKHITSKLLSLLLTLAMLMSMVPAAYAADGDESDGSSTGGGYVTVNDSGNYATLDEAISEAMPDESGTITYGIYGKVEVTSTAAWIQVAKAGLDPAPTKVEFVGSGSDAEISITNSQSVLADQEYDLDVSFTNLTLSHPGGAWVKDLGHATNYFTCALRNTNAAENTVTYTNCTFPNGVCNNLYGKTVFTSCSFTNNADGMYNLWNYGGVTEVTDSSFTGTRGIKTYNEGNIAVAPTVTVSNTTFTGLTQKSAIVTSKPTDITLTGVTVENCDNGLITRDISNNDELTIYANGSNISGTFNIGSDPGAEAAKTEFNITAGTFKASVDSAYCADGFEVKQNTDGTYGVQEAQPSADGVAQVGDVQFTDVAEAITAAQNGIKTVTLLEANTALVQDILDGKYGSINGLRLELAAGTYDALTVGRVVAGAQDDSIVYTCNHTDDTHYSYDTEEQYKEHLAENVFHYTSTYTRTMSGVTLAANGNVTIKGLLITSGHLYQEANPFCEGGEGYYLNQTLTKFAFEGINFVGNVNIETSSEDTTISNFTFYRCSFTTEGTGSEKKQALRYYNENNNGQVNNLYVSDCTFNNCYQGVYTMKVKGVSVTGSSFDTIGHNAIAVQGEDCDHGNVVITGNTFNNISDRIIRFNKVGAGTSILITNNTATNSGDENREVIKAEDIADGVTINMPSGSNSWGDGAVLGNGFAQNDPMPADTIKVSNEKELREALYNAPANGSQVTIQLTDDVTLEMLYAAENFNMETLADNAAGDTFNRYKRGVHPTTEDPTRWNPLVTSQTDAEKAVYGAYYHTGANDERIARLVVKEGQNVVLDINGHNLMKDERATYGDWSETCLNLIGNYGTLKIIDSEGTGMITGSGFASCSPAVIQNYGGKLTIGSVIIDGGASSKEDQRGQYVIMNGEKGSSAYEDGELVLDGTIIFDDATSASLIYSAAGTMTIQNNAVLSHKNTKVINVNGGKVIVDGAEITSDAIAINAEGGTVEIKAATVNGTGVVSATNGTVTKADDVTLNTADNCKWVNNTLAVYVARITSGGNTKYYETLQAAIDAAASGRTVYLMTDVTLSEPAVFPAGKVVHINLYGHNITAEGIALCINGTTDIQDTKNTGTIESTKRAAVAVGNNSKLTVYSGTIKGREGAVVTGLSTGATIEIRYNATLIATDNAVIAGNGTDREGAPNKITVKGSTIVGSITTDGYIACGIYAPWKDIVTVSGGTFNIKDGAGIVARGGTVKVSGGTFNCTGEKTGWVGDNKNMLPCAPLVFDTAAGYPGLAEDSAITVSGGTFSGDPIAHGATLADGYVTTETDGVYGVQKENPVAEVDGVKYGTLFGAVVAANKNGGTIKLLQDSNVPDMYYSITGNVTIDLNGHNITGNGAQGVFYVYTSAHLTIKGEGTITAVENNKAAMAVQVYSDNAKVTLEGGTYKQQITNKDDPQFDLIYVHHGTAEIKGGTYECETPAWTLNCYDENYKNGSAKIEVTGGKFNGFNPEDNTAEGESTNFIPAGYAVTKNSDGTYTVAEGSYVAAIGDVKYTTLADAIAAAKDSETVKLLADTDISTVSYSRLEVRTSFTLDLNGKALKAANTSYKGNITIYNATLTLIDSTDIAKNGTGTGKIWTDTVYTGGSTTRCLITASVNGHFVMESGLIDAASFATDPENQGQFAVGIYNDVTTSTASVTINGGHIKAGWYAVAGNGREVMGTGNITINGGMLESTADYAIYHPQYGTTTINGGTVYGEAGGILLNKGALVVNGGIITSKGTGSTGDWGDGTGNAKSAAINIQAKYGDAAAEIKGGKITAENEALLLTTETGDKGTGTIAVSGGFFSSAVKEEYCAVGYEPDAEVGTDGMYTVKKASGNAAYYDADGKLLGYADVENAVKAEGAVTVKLIADATADVLALRNNITLDLNGKTLTAMMLVGFAGTVIDSSEGEGLLKLDNENYLTLAKSNSYLPLYDTAAQGYRFFSYKFLARGIAKTETDDKKQFWFRIEFGSDKAYTLLKNAGHGLEIRLSVQTGSDDPMEAVVPQAAITQWVKAIKINGGQYDANKTGFYMAVKGLSNIGDATVIVSGIAKTHGVEIRSDGALTYPKAN